MTFAGVSCKSKVTKVLQMKFVSPMAAEKYYIAVLAASAEKPSNNSNAQMLHSSSSSTFSAQTKMFVPVMPLTQIMTTLPSLVHPTTSSLSIPAMPVFHQQILSSN